MPQFIINQEMVTDGPTIEVTATPDKPIPRGRQRFRLVVTDDSGNVSRADEVVIIVADQDIPTAVLTAPTTVAFGRSFNLSGERSVDTGGGKIVRFAWTYVGPAT
jgi:hypothetical protein